MASEADQYLVGVSLPDGLRAQEFLTAATRLGVKQMLKLRDAVIVTKDEHGHTAVRETIDPQPGRAALSSGMWTGLLGLIVGGPVGWLVGGAVGAGVGAASAKFIDLGVPDEWVQWFRDAVQPNTTTVVLLLEDLAPAVAFFTALGMEVEGEMPVEGEWADRINGIADVRVDPHHPVCQA